MTKGTPWKIEEETQLKKLIEAKTPTDTIAQTLKRTPTAILLKCQRLGLVPSDCVTKATLPLPDELPSVEETLKELAAAIFAVVEQDALADYNIYSRNKQNKNIDVSKLNYRNVDSIKVFDFIDEVQKNAVNNALVPFSTANEIEIYLKQQWAGMMYNFLSDQAENRRMGSVLDSLTLMNQRIENLATQILQIVGTNSDKAMAEFNQQMQKHAVIQFLDKLKIESTIKPIDIANNASFEDLMDSLGFPIAKDKDGVYQITRNKNGVQTMFSITTNAYMSLQLNYDDLRKQAMAILKKYRVI